MIQLPSAPMHMAKASEPALQLQEAFYTFEFYLVSGYRLLPRTGGATPKVSLDG
jgi:hypothetical protein